jgi:hypothetical protein
MYNNQQDFVLNGIAQNPLTSVTKLKQVCAVIRERLDNGELSDAWKTRYTHALTVALERING